ncbi:RNA-binding protein [Clostridioides difficile]|uniref:RNA-binding protein n=1 Tax=Clostridioides difficile TaxID=1496 RepID=A0A9P3WTP2_CLODI|nr:RNA-binding protein [Clostridioides difficile]AWH78315.1 RNA-binding protein [Clostridioides difficile]AWH82056.1 RNA-binding protein [Clostridioides difficile]AXU47220.1 RNA-binding cell division protein [Clostridioides difficile]AXU50880.1 RNA-binding cell division protein [Clostridioides difficile]AXU76473.1 RNA-binding cell division protein [Clostridioides difficile]
MDKLKLTNHIKDIDLKNKMFKVIDKANSCIKNYDVKSTEFLNPYEVKNAVAILNSTNEIKYSVDGGYEQAERSTVFIYPFYMEYEDIEDTLRFLQIEGNFKFKNISHKDYLGSILSLGIKREKIGDIIIHDSFCQVVVSSDICDFIIVNLEKVSRNNVIVKEISRENIVNSSSKYKEVSFTVSSDRLDCVISGIYNISRQDSAKYINGEKVHVNYEKITSTSKIVKNDDLISIRGKGRAKVTQIGDITKKGKIKVQARLIV